MRGLSHEGLRIVQSYSYIAASGAWPRGPRIKTSPVKRHYRSIGFKPVAAAQALICIIAGLRPFGGAPSSTQRCRSRSQRPVDDLA